MDFVKILGGLALGATGAALYDALSSGKKIGTMGQGVVTGGFGGGPGGGGFGGGPGVVSGGPGGGGFGGGPGVVSVAPAGGSGMGPGFGPGVIVGPPGGGGAGMGPGFGPGVIDIVPEGGGEGPVGPIVSVPPEFSGPGGFGGDSFFGISSSPWFWPLNVNWMFPQPPKSMVCVETKNKNDEKVTICQETYAARPLYGQQWPMYAWGPPAGWL
jgi:hypothetical protein